MKILVAEDDIPYSRFIRIMLEGMQHEVVTAPDGQAAYEQLQSGHFPLLITDWMMPKMDGIELTELARALDRPPRFTYIIVLTSLTEREHLLKGMRAGADDFLTKPLDPEILAVRVRVAERIMRLQQESTALSTFLPMCSCCKKVREDSTRWVSLADYVNHQVWTGNAPTVCPDCKKGVTT